MRKALNQKRLRQWAAAGGACCFIAGIIAPLLGMLLTASGWIFGVAVHPWIHATGTALLIVAIPLILFAGFFLDWAERRPMNASDNDRDPELGKSSPEYRTTRKVLKRDVGKAGLTLDEEITFVPRKNGNGDRTSFATGLEELQKTREYFGKINSKTTKTHKV